MDMAEAFVWLIFIWGLIRILKAKMNQTRRK